MRPIREDIVTAAHGLTQDLPLALRARYPVSKRAMLKSLAVESLTLHYPYAPVELVVPKPLGRFARRSPAIPVEGLGDPLPETEQAFSLVLDLLHAHPTEDLATTPYGVYLRLRYRVEADQLEGGYGFWPRQTGSPLVPVSAVFHLSYITPY